MDKWGMIAEYKNPSSLYEAAKKLRDAGYRKFEVYSPFPIHGMDDAMGIKPTPLPWIVLFGGFLGFTIGVTLSVWSSTQGYRMIISGKPDGFLALAEFFPIIFELTILFAVFSAVFGMFVLNKLPTFYRPIFTHDFFKKVTDDGFFITVEKADKKYSEKTTKEFLQKIGGDGVTIIED